jgi:hypothetical protein
MFHRIIIASVIGAYISALSVQCATLDEVLGTALVCLALGTLDYVVVFDVAYLASDYPPKHSDQDRVAGVLVGPFIDNGVRFLAESLPTCRCEPILRMDAHNYAIASVSFARLLVPPVVLEILREVSWSDQDIVTFSFYAIVHKASPWLSFRVIDIDID